VRPDLTQAYGAIHHVASLVALDAVMQRKIAAPSRETMRLAALHPLQK
jgi:hypothetical protein